MANADLLTVRLELIAAKARQLAEDYKRGRLYRDELEIGLREVACQLQLAQEDARRLGHG